MRKPLREYDARPAGEAWADCEQRVELFRANMVRARAESAEKDSIIAALRATHADQQAMLMRAWENQRRLEAAIDKLNAAALGMASRLDPLAEPAAFAEIDEKMDDDERPKQSNPPQEGRD